MARAICALDSVFRWAVTGTPIRNNLSDLGALLKFLKAYPYHDRKQFNKDFTDLWKYGPVEEAVHRLRRLSECLILRRPSDTITLPKRRDLRCPIEFSTEERTLYNEIRSQALERIDNLMSGSDDITRSTSYVIILQQVEAMRMVCTLGLRYQTGHQNIATNTTQGDGTPTNWGEIAQQIFNTQRGIDHIYCQNCSVVAADDASLVDENLNTTLKRHPLFSQCMKFICSECATERPHLRPVCGHDTPCPFAPVSLDVGREGAFQGGFPREVGEKQQATPPPPNVFPTKVISLITQLKALHENTKRFVSHLLIRFAVAAIAGVSTCGQV